MEIKQNFSNETILREKALYFTPLNSKIKEKTNLTSIKQLLEVLKQAQTINNLIKTRIKKVKIESKPEFLYSKKGLFNSNCLLNKELIALKEKKRKYIKFLLTTRFMYSDELITLQNNIPYSIDFKNSDIDKWIISNNKILYSKIEQEEMFIKFREDKKQARKNKQHNKRLLKSIYKDLSTLAKIGLK